MRLAIVAVLAVGAVGLAIGGLTMINAENHNIPYSQYFQLEIDCFEAPAHGPFRVQAVSYILENNTPFKAKVTTEHTITDNDEHIITKTNTLEPDEIQRYSLTTISKNAACPEPEETSRITNVNFLNITSTDILGLLTEKQQLSEKIESNPTAFYGTIYTINGVKAGIEVIVVNMADHSDIKRDITNSEGDYFIKTAPGPYLIQAIGGGPESYEYTTITDHELKRIDLKY